MLQPSRIALGAAHLPWLALLAWLTSVSWFLTDDAFISFRYVRNLLNGHGLVFNVGERVEGYSNFLWILELAAIWRILDIRPEHASPWLSVLFTAGTLALMLWWIARLPRLRMRWLVSWMALALVCGSATFAVWTSGGGLETRQFTFFVVAAVVCLSLYRNRGWGLFAASTSLALASLTRPEGPLIAACCFAWFGALQILDAMSALRRAAETQDVSIVEAIAAISRRIDWRGTICLIAPFALIVGAHFLFRYAYYGEWLPNTYYAKHVRPWYEAGFKYLWAGALETGLYLLLPLAWGALRARWRDARDDAYALILLIMAAHMLFLARLGGDHFEFRPMDFYWPLLAVPAAEGIARLGGWIADKLRHMRINAREGAFRFRLSADSMQLQQSANPIWARLWTLLLFVPVLFYASAMQWALLFDLDYDNPEWHAHIDLDERNAGWLMAAPGMKALTAVSNDLREAMSPSVVAMRFVLHRIFADSRIKQYQPYENMERGIIPDDAVMAAAAIGVPYYYLSELTIVDRNGLTDATIARVPSSRSNSERKIAHDRHPPPGYLKERGVNIEIHEAADTAGQALARAQYTVQVGPDLWMPFDSTDADWVINRFSKHSIYSKENALLKTHPTIPSANQAILPDGRLLFGERFIGDFESGMNGWRIEGDAVTNHADFESYQGQQDIIGNIGPGFLTSHHPVDGDILTGGATSTEFAAEAGQYLAFLIAGGMGDGVGVRLLSGDEEVAVWRGQNTEQFRPVIHPLAELAGSTLQLQLFDNESGVWGHIMLDHVIILSGNPLVFSKTHPTAPSENQVILPDGRPLYGDEFIGDFESGMNGWRIEGDAVTNHADFEVYRLQQDIIGNIGLGFLTSYHPTENDILTGGATSPEFAAEAGQYLAFLIAGGMGDGVGVRLLSGGEEVAVWRGQNTEQFRPVIHPLAELAGSTLQLQLFDNESGVWGHIMLDHVLILE